MRSDVSENAKKRNPLRLRSGLRLTRLRGNGVMIGYELRGPSPESSTLADVASASRQLAAAFMHLHSTPPEPTPIERESYITILTASLGYLKWRSRSK
jgi:hypothetical protein